MPKFHFWIAARGSDGKPYLIYGSQYSESAARQKAMEMLPDLEWKILRLPTRDISAASSMARGKRLEQTHDLTESSRRIGHEKSLARRNGQKSDPSDRFSRGIFG